MSFVIGLIFIAMALWDLYHIKDWESETALAVAHLEVMVLFLAGTKALGGW